MNRPTQDVPLEVQNRETTITVRAPTPPKLMMLSARLKIAGMTGEEVQRSLTLEELHTESVTLITALTDLPRSFVEQLPAAAIDDLMKACSAVIEEDQRRQERDAEQFQQHMNGVPNDERVAAIFNFVARRDGEQ